MHTAALAPPDSIGATRVRSFGIVSSFPPTSCGIATFSAALAAGLVGGGASVNVVRCGQAPDTEDVVVVGSLDDPTDLGHRRAIAALNRNEVVIVQHEYGLYDGADGESVIDVIASIAAPVVVVAHTVLTKPTTNQRRVLQQVCRHADAIVVMTETARQRLLVGYDVVRSKVHVIPHGAATPLAAPSASQRRPGTPPRVLTWGLLGPGKGIEWAIDAFAELGDIHPAPTYTIAGATHPKVRERSGEAYREMLVDRAERSGARSSVSFDDSYRDLESLTELIRSADLVVLPYDSADQVTSGVLVDAVAAGCPVVSTAFPHAVELLASGAGMVVPQRDPAALAKAIRAVLTDDDLRRGMAAEARRLAPDLSWAAVAGRYDSLGARLIADRSVQRPVTS